MAMGDLPLLAPGLAADRAPPTPATAGSAQPGLPILPLRLQGLGYRIPGHGAGPDGGQSLLSGVDLTIAPGRRLVVLGPNGAGKSLLLRLCHGMIAPSEGQVIWADGQGGRPAAQAMVFQRPVMLRRSVRGNLAHAAALAGLARGVRRARVDAALARFGLADLAGRGAPRLSGGEQQRLALARAWIRQPQILFLDEPSSALDPGATRAIEAIITRLSAEGMTIVMTTHDLGQARRLADDVAFLHRGRLIEQGPAARFFDSPATAQARGFLAGDLLW